MRQSNIEFRDDDDDDGSDGGLMRGAPHSPENYQLHLPSDSYVYVYYCQSPWQIGTTQPHCMAPHTPYIESSVVCDLVGMLWSLLESIGATWILPYLCFQDSF